MGKGVSRRWAAADCETDAFDGRAVEAFIWGVCEDDGARHIFHSTAEFVAWAKEYDGIIYAHNGGRFDWAQPEIVAAVMEADQQLQLINGRLAKASLGKAELRDSWLILPGPLSAFGAKDTEFDYTILHRHRKKDRAAKMAAIEKYLMQDCVVLRDAIARFFSVHGLVLTQAGAALRFWEKTLGGAVRRYGPAHDAAMRPWYFGGRCEAFRRGKIDGPIRYYDINSSYPDSMCDDHPIGPFTQYARCADLDDIQGASFWVIKCDSGGAFPLKIKGIGTVFPNDGQSREYRVTGWELIAALECGLLRDIKYARGLRSVGTESMREYSEYCFSERKRLKDAGDNLGQYLMKILANSGYGKFGSNPERYRDYQITRAGEKPPGDDWGILSHHEDSDIWHRPTSRRQYFDLAMAASITGHARAKLIRAIAGSEDVIYCDTDSVMCRKFGGGEIGDKLGQWKLEAEFSELHVAGKKLYAGKIVGADAWKSAHKGFSKLDTEIGDIIRAASGEVIIINQTAPSCSPITGKQKFLPKKMRIT